MLSLFSLSKICRLNFCSGSKIKKNILTGGVGNGRSADVVRPPLLRPRRHLRQGQGDHHHLLRKDSFRQRKSPNQRSNNDNTINNGDDNNNDNIGFATTERTSTERSYGLRPLEQQLLLGRNALKLNLI